MGFVQECPQCRAKLRLPESGVGRCPKCKAVVRRDTTLSLPQGANTGPMELIPEISEEHEVVPPAPIAPLPMTAGYVEPYIDLESDPAPPPLPRSRRRGRERVPDIDIAHPPERPSRTLPVTFLATGFVLSLLAVMWSFFYLVYSARR